MERNYVTVNLCKYTGNQLADVTKRVDSALWAMLRYGPCFCLLVCCCSLLYFLSLLLPCIIVTSRRV